MTTPSRTRLVRDFKRLKHDPPEGIEATPNPSNIMHWDAVIFGPEDTPWDGGTFKLTLQFSEDYPNRAPVVKFVSKMFHPNIYQDGSICLDILQKQWSPIYDVWAILTSIQSLLTDPNPNSPANQEAAKLFAENKREYLRQVQDCVAESWMEKSGDLDENGDDGGSETTHERTEFISQSVEVKKTEDEDNLDKEVIKDLKRDPEVMHEDGDVHRDRCDGSDGNVFKRVKCEKT